MIWEAPQQVWKYFELICDDIIHDSDLEDFPKADKNQQNKNVLPRMWTAAVVSQSSPLSIGKGARGISLYSEHTLRQNAISKAIARIFEKINDIKFCRCNFIENQPLI